MRNSYVFESFVTNSTNDEAVRVCRAVAELPGTLNPVWLYGRPGCGKSHLAGAVSSVAETDPHRTMVHVTSEELSQALMMFLADDPPAWQLIQQADLLILENIDFFSGMEMTQRYLADMIADKCKRGQQVIITAEAPPDAFEGIDEVMAGIRNSAVVKVEFPDGELCRAYIKSRRKEVLRCVTALGARCLTKSGLCISQLEGVLSAAKLHKAHFGKRANVRWIKNYVANIN